MNDHLLSRTQNTPPAALVEQVDSVRLLLSNRLDAARRADLGQYFTPAPIARLMASLFAARVGTIRILDAGAGVGNLSAALVAELCERQERPTAIELTAYEVDTALIPHLNDALDACDATCARAGIDFKATIRNDDFIDSATTMLESGLFASSRESFDCAILNPPYHKLNSKSAARFALRRIGIETSNLYTAFMTLVMRLLDGDGEMVAITPRSFCNGPYFRPFREEFLSSMCLRQLHVFESRNAAFRDDEVLQENVILHAAKDSCLADSVIISSSSGAADEVVSVRTVPYEEVVQPQDDDLFIRIAPDELARGVGTLMANFSATLADLGLTASTGRVVDFRAKEYLRQQPDTDTAPLIYPTHFAAGRIAWPKETRKPNALAVAPQTKRLFVPAGVYVLVKRFSAKEEPRRVVAAIYDPADVPGEVVGFENHLNYFHLKGRGLPLGLARGLAAFLNSSLLDAHFRQFNGNTQVNATDLRNLRYPTREQLERLGEKMPNISAGQQEIDRLVEEELLLVSGNTSGIDPIKAREKINRALAILKDVDLPKGQHNERSALALLALLDIKPDTPWSEAKSPMLGITPTMEFMSEHYGKKYAPNSRETVRKQTMHQFVLAGIAAANPDDPKRATNSKNNVYQARSVFVELIRLYGTPEWEEKLRTYRGSAKSLQEHYAKQREMHRIPVILPGGQEVKLSPGGQNVLIEKIIEEFCGRFTPGGRVLYIGDTGEKFSHIDRVELKELGIVVPEHGKMPDVVVHHVEKGWLVLIEAVTSHGPVDGKRYDELKELFKGCKLPLVFVTAFLSRAAMVRYLGEIAWETEVWVAEAPSHMIHFNGERFLGPYPE